MNQKRKELRKENSNITTYEDYSDMFWYFEESLAEKNDELCEEMPF